MHARCIVESADHLGESVLWRSRDRVIAQQMKNEPEKVAAQCRDGVDKGYSCFKGKMDLRRLVST
ncbi:MAG: hypothetical protein OEU92_08525 [Alphaproteobacteria bacterium]|nr:hypothetical protein [Alphaproteobacteria bacterium]